MIFYSKIGKQNGFKIKNFIKSSTNLFIPVNKQTQINICQNTECKDIYTNKKLISISPGGLKGFYLLGISTFIKETYNLDNYVFSGASAGAWNALYMTYKGNPREFIKKVLDENTNKAKTVIDVKNIVKENIVKNYNNDDFDLDHLFIGVKTFAGTSIYSNFENVEDAVDCCIASSHIPFVTGGMMNVYHNKYSFDGGFSDHPYVKIPSVLHITPNIWLKNELDEYGNRVVHKGDIFHIKNDKDTNKDINKDTNKNNDNKKESSKLCFNIHEYTTLFSRSKYDLKKTYENGYNDTKENRSKLDNLFLKL
jgi:hypothetical protein